MQGIDGLWGFLQIVALIYKYKKGFLNQNVNKAAASKPSSLLF